MFISPQYIGSKLSLLLNNLISKFQTYPNIYYLTICLGMALIFAYKIVKLVI